jgi:hypothetical protein
MTLQTFVIADRETALGRVGFGFQYDDTGGFPVTITALVGVNETGLPAEAVLGYRDAEGVTIREFSRVFTQSGTVTIPVTRRPQLRLPVVKLWEDDRIYSRLTWPVEAV